MIRTTFAAGLACLAAVVVLCPIRAEEPSTSRARVVIVGISKYKDPKIKARKHPETDAQDLYKLFTDKNYLGADPKNVRLLLGSPNGNKNAQEANRANILKALEWLADGGRSDDLTLFVFIGEGGPLGEKGDKRCYFAVDSTLDQRAKNAIAASEIEDRLNKLKSERFVALIDINFKGFDAGKEVIPDVTLGPTAYREFLGDDGSDEHNPRPGRVVFLATNGLSASLDLKENGLFTHVLINGLKGQADVFGYEPDGVITVSELVAYMSKEMPALARKFGKTEKEQDQVHFVLGDRNLSFPITTNPAVATKVAGLRAKLKELVEAGKLDRKLGEEGDRLLRQMPRVKAQQELRKKFQELASTKLKVEDFLKEHARIKQETQLEKKSAESFADKVLDACRLLRSEYVRNLSDGTLIAQAIQGMYRQLQERLPTELAAKLKTPAKLERGELRDLLVEARMHLGKREDLERGKDVTIAIQRMLNKLDPYTLYVDKESIENFHKGTEGAFVGIGVLIRKDRATDMLMVVTPLKNGPAFKKGIRAGDIITSIILETDPDGKKLEKPEIVSTKGMTSTEAVKRIKGKPGTTVKLTIQRSGETNPIELEIERARVEMETVMGYQRKEAEEWDFMVDKETRIGYIRLSQFTRGSARDMVRALLQLQRDKVQGLVLDLRFNPGGLLYIAEQICDLFIDDGLIVSVKPREGKEDRRYGVSDGSFLNFPMVVLINGGSASGSEIVAACLQDHRRAVVMGERSYGKGLVQNVVPFNGGEIKLTTSYYYRPNGKNIEKTATKGSEDEEWGVLPDRGFLLKLDPKETDDLEEWMHESEIIMPRGVPVKRTNPTFKDRQLAMALQYLREQIKLAEKAKPRK